MVSRLKNKRESLVDIGVDRNIEMDLQGIRCLVWTGLFGLGCLDWVVWTGLFGLGCSEDTAQVADTKLKVLA